MIEDNSLERFKMIKGFQEQRGLIPTREKTEMTKNCFWIPEKTPETKRNLLNKPSDKLYCGIREENHLLKLKELTILNVSISEVDNKHICAICQKNLSLQKIVAIKKCGHTFCKVFILIIYYLEMFDKCKQKR